jgi:hypothetical protein
MWDSLAEDFARGGNSIEELRMLKASGLVTHIVLEVFPWTSNNPLQALKAGYCDGLIDAFIFYFNPLQRFAHNALWNEIVARNFPVIAMRTISGGPVHALRDVPVQLGFHICKNVQLKLLQYLNNPVIASWTEFCVRFAHSSLL